MKIKELKEDLGKLLICDLEEFGLSSHEIESSDTVQLYTTTDDYCQSKSESTWMASVNTDEKKFLIILNGLLYDQPTAEIFDEETEIASIFVDEPKAEMLVDALFHSYPELVRSRIDQQDESKDFDQKLKELEEDYESHGIDEKIGLLKRETARLEKLRDASIIADSDESIDVYQKVKEFSGKYKEEKVEPAIVKRKNTTLFIGSFKDQKKIKLVEANVRKIALEKTSNLNTKQITKTILIDKKLAATLNKAFKETFK